MWVPNMWSNPTCSKLNTVYHLLNIDVLGKQELYCWTFTWVALVMSHDLRTSLSLLFFICGRAFFPFNCRQLSTTIYHLFLFCSPTRSNFTLFPWDFLSLFLHCTVYFMSILLYTSSRRVVDMLHPTYIGHQFAMPKHLFSLGLTYSM